MAQPQAYSMAELTRCKLLHEASVKNRDLRRLVGHVNMYDRLIDVMNAEEIREREQSPPKSIKSESEARHVKFAACPSPTRLEDQACKPAEEELGELGYAAHFESVSLVSQDGYGIVQVAEVEILDDD
ncbi:hypothetical protein N431DRAFT_429221 [Stipitochalara longipes BDJ]|nr:hypothetical protein N431DRAFT_429221 [Stipitochalara longipes BDJ]